MYFKQKLSLITAVLLVTAISSPAQQIIVPCQSYRAFLEESYKRLSSKMSIEQRKDLQSRIRELKEFETKERPTEVSSEKKVKTVSCPTEYTLLPPLGIDLMTEKTAKIIWEVSMQTGITANVRISTQKGGEETPGAEIKYRTNYSNGFIRAGNLTVCTEKLYLGYYFFQAYRNSKPTSPEQGPFLVVDKDLSITIQEDE